MASSGELVSNQNHDRILASGSVARFETEATLSEFTLPDLHHQRHRIAVPVRPQRGPGRGVSSITEPVRLSKGSRLHVSAGKSLKYENWL